jgi:NADH:ubiquinone oxidoreductase subunit 4 (subunit M)
LSVHIPGLSTSPWPESPSPGPVRHAVISEAVDLRNRELALVVVLAGPILLLGLWPSSVLDITRVASEARVGHLK